MSFRSFINNKINNIIDKISGTPSPVLANTLYRDFLNIKLDDVINAIPGTHTITPAPANELYRDFIERKINDIINAIDDMPQPTGDSSDITVVYSSLNLDVESYTITESGYYIIIASGAGNNGNAVDITIPATVTPYIDQKFMYENANWYGAVKICLTELNAGDVVRMNVGTATYSQTQRKTIFKLTDIPVLSSVISSSIKTDGISNDISTDLTLPAAGKVFIIAGCNGKELRYDYETRTETGYSFLQSGIGGRTIPFTGFLRIGYFDVTDIPYLTVSAADGGLSWLIAIQ